VTSTMAATDAGRRRLLLFVAIGAAVLLAGLVLPRVLLGGGGGGEDEEVSAPPTTTAPGAAAEGSEAFDDGGNEGDALPVATFSTKNPFTPLVDISATTGAATDTGTTTDQTGETGDVPPGDTGATAPGTATGSSEPARAAAGVSIVDIYTGPDGAPVATVEVDGTMSTVREGDAFGDGYQVISLSQASRSGVFSRDGQQFTVREGEALLK
jgi:hypothetical protein